VRTYVHRVAAWSPTRRGPAAWRDGPDLPAPPVDGLLGAGRRRATLLSRIAADLLDQLGAADVALVMGSAGGEYEQTFATLPLMYESPPASSPLRFGNSVHNTALGQVSIATGNRRFASALSARPADLAAMVLLEAATLGQPVAALWAEETWPEATWPALGAGLLLSNDETGSLGALHDLRRTGAPFALHPATGGSPAAGALALVSALGDAPATVALGGGWEVRWTPR
jgi:hypothetical protein